MFKLVKDRRAWWPVEWKAAAEDGGELIDNRIELRFRVMEVEALFDWRDRAAKLDGLDRKSARTFATRAAEAVMEIADDWRGVAAENGETLPWSAENVARLMSMPNMLLIVIQAFNDCLAGREKVREGN
jgi:hypothetical protein